jgi:hypothetical protein
LLVQLLQQAGHDVRVPADLGQSGQADAVHLKLAIRDDSLLLSRNHDDFQFLHELILEAKGHHPGILIVCRENNPKRDLTAKGIVRAIAKLLAAQTSFVDQFMVLNHWR